MEDTEEVTIDPMELFKPFEIESGGIRTDAVIMNLVYLLQTDSKAKRTRKWWVNFAKQAWDHVEKLPKVSKYQ